MSIKERIVRTFSFIFIISMSLFYIVRAGYFYINENGFTLFDDNRVYTIYDRLLSNKNVTDFGDGLNYLEDEDIYRYTGEVDNNYVSYAGQLWRVLEITPEKEMVLVSDKPVTILSYNGDFSNSGLNKWLSDPEVGVFPTIFSDQSVLLDHSIDTSTYSEDEIKNLTIKSQPTEVKVGLLDVPTYIEAGAGGSFLNSESNFWLANKTDSGSSWFVSNKGGFNVNHQDSAYYGVRPTIKISADVTHKLGTGIENDPYIFEEKFATYLTDGMVGDYVSYKEQLWRIVEKNETGVKLALEGYADLEKRVAFSGEKGTFSTTSESNVGYYLNETYLETVDSEIVIEGIFNNGVVESGEDYTGRTSRTVDAKVGMLGVGDFYLGDYEDVFTMTQASYLDNLYTIYAINSNGWLYTDLPTAKYLTRPVLSVTGDVIILDGNGLKETPLIISE